MREEGFKEEEIDTELYFHTEFFRGCVPRAILPPSKLYWRVRAVFVLFGNKIDSKTGKPLFNAEAWKKANNVLKEILAGHFSDPPGIPIYELIFDSDGAPMLNALGFHMMRSLRGTNGGEAMHRQSNQAFSGWVTGIRMGHFLLGEFQHRYTHAMSERNRPGFPKFGHCDTWLVDELQVLVSENHGVLLYPAWSNTSEFAETPERAGVVPIQDEELTERVNNIVLDDDAFMLTDDLAFLAKRTGVSIPFLPVSGRDEYELFTKLVLKQPGAFDEYEMALTWCDYVDGKTIFPKLPIYLRNHYEKFQKNQRIKDAVK